MKILIWVLYFIINSLDIYFLLTPTFNAFLHAGRFPAVMQALQIGRTIENFFFISSTVGWSSLSSKSPQKKQMDVNFWVIPTKVVLDVFSSINSKKNNRHYPL